MDRRFLFRRDDLGGLQSGQRQRCGRVDQFEDDQPLSVMPNRICLQPIHASYRFNHQYQPWSWQMLGLDVDVGLSVLGIGERYSWAAGLFDLTAVVSSGGPSALDDHWGGGRAPASFPYMYATVNHPSESSGKLWKVPMGINRRTVADAHKNSLSGWPVALKLGGSAGNVPAEGGTSEYDERNLFTANLIGRLAQGDNSGASTSVANLYGDEFLSDIVEAGTVGSVYLGDNSNSAENATAPEAVMGYCGSQNYSIYIGMYLGLSANSMYCMDPKGTLNAPAWTTSNGFNANLFIGGQNGGPSGSPLLFKDSYTGNRWRVNGLRQWNVTSTGMNGASTTDVLVSTSGQMLFAGLTITDTTTRSAVPTGTTISKLTAGHIIASQPVAVQSGDVLQISTTGVGPCMAIGGGVGNNQQGLYFDKNCSTVTSEYLSYNGYRNMLAWSGNNSLDAPILALFNTDYLGYSPGGTGGAILPQGFMLGGAANSLLGQERFVDNGVAVPTQNWHLRGDLHFNSTPSAGSPMAWVNTRTFDTTATQPFTTVAGTNSITVAACPSPALPAGTPISDTALVPNKNFGTLTSCTAGTLNTLAFIATAANIASSGAADAISFVQWRPGPPIANDTAGTDYSIPNVMRSGKSTNVDLVGRIALTGGAASYTLAGTYASAPNCLCSDVTKPANACSVSESTTALIFAGTGTDTVKWICVGRN